MLGTLAELAARVDGTVVGDGSVRVERVAAIGDATADALTFATDPKYLEPALESKAAAVLVEASLVPEGTPAKPLLAVANARHALATLLASLRSPRPKGPFRHPSAAIDPTADVAEDAYVGAQAYIGPGARVGARAAIDACAYVGPNVTVGADSWLHPNATVREGCTLGERVVLASGCVIGGEGFGWAFLEGVLERIPQVGNVAIGNDVEIGANTCVDRAQTGSTSIGDGTKIDNLCQIGHNCRIGKHTVMAATTALAGSTVIGDFCQIGGQATFKGHLTVGNHVQIGGKSEIWKDVPDNSIVSGAPAQEHKDHLRLRIRMQQLPKLYDRVAALERRARGED